MQIGDMHTTKIYLLFFNYRQDNVINKYNKNETTQVAKLKTINKSYLMKIN